MKKTIDRSVLAFHATLTHQRPNAFIALFLGFLSLMICASAQAAKPPVADLSYYSNVKGVAPLKSHFDARQSICDDVAVCASYRFKYDDGFEDSGNGEWGRADHTYTSVGKYTVTLTVTDTIGRKASTTLQVIVVPAESLTSYVAACQSELNFQSIPDLDCYDGDLFDPAAGPMDPVNDFLGYKKITDQVDLAFACRWLKGSKARRKPAVSIEMLIHNRQKGGTCFFSGKIQQNVPDPDLGKTNAVPSIITSPTNCVSPSNCAAATYWNPPAFVDANVRCIGCHVSGPYLASPKIAPYLAKHGLMNNGHDTLSDTTVKYHAISGTVNGAPGAFSQWDSLRQSYAVVKECAIGCHMVGTGSPQGDIAPSDRSPVMLHGPDSLLGLINSAGVMEPYDEFSDYRWINLDTPGDGVESETFASGVTSPIKLLPTLLSSCGAPGLMEAHVVSSENKFLVTQPSKFAYLPDRLSVFNLKDGLVCLNSDQEPGTQCQDYRVHYECTDASGKKSWTAYQSMDTQSGDGDHEERYKVNPCSGSTATSIEAAVTLGGGSTYFSIGPNDRLASFSQYGLTCNNADQPDGKCSNYVVRYSSCDKPPIEVNQTLTNVNTSAGSKQLTAASNSLVKGQAHDDRWNTQLWVVKPIDNTEYVRLQNTSNGVTVYLNVLSTAERTVVGTAAFNSTAKGEMWLIEPITGSTDVRIKNLLSGKYLTMADPNTIDATLKDYVPIYSQSRTTGWNTQRWALK